MAGNEAGMERLEMRLGERVGMRLGTEMRALE